MRSGQTSRTVLCQRGVAVFARTQAVLDFLACGFESMAERAFVQVRDHSGYFLDDFHHPDDFDGGGDLADIDTGMHAVALQLRHARPEAVEFVCGFVAQRVAFAFHVDQCEFVSTNRVRISALLIFEPLACLGFLPVLEEHHVAANAKRVLSVDESGNMVTPNVIVLVGGLVPKGVFDDAIDYQVGDSVSYGGSSYVMYVDAPAGTLPTDTDYWQVLASKGDTGATGSTGAKGDTGSAAANDGTVNFFDGDPVEGSWRITINGANLNFERYESGNWIEKASATA